MRRILWAIVLFLTITMVAYVIFFIIPANPAQLACGQRASPACIRNATQNLGLDKPVYVQYGRSSRGSSSTTTSASRTSTVRA